MVSVFQQVSVMQIFQQAWVDKELRLTRFYKCSQWKPGVWGTTYCGLSSLHFLLLSSAPLCPPPTQLEAPYLPPALFSPLHRPTIYLAHYNLTQNIVNWRHRNILNSGNVLLWVWGCWVRAGTLFCALCLCVCMCVRACVCVWVLTFCWIPSQTRKKWMTSRVCFNKKPDCSVETILFVSLNVPLIEPL